MRPCERSPRCHSDGSVDLAAVAGPALMRIGQGQGAADVAADVVVAAKEGVVAEVTAIASARTSATNHVLSYASPGSCV